jgi:signal transduction histidine kinase
LERDAEQALRAALEAATALDGALDDIARRLHPLELEQLGLAEALRRQVGQRAADSAAAIRFSENLGVERFTETLEVGCFRVVEEALDNALRHAQARTIEISLARRGHHLWLSVQDDGVGFDVESTLAGGNAQARGLVGMRARVHVLGGDLDIDARSGAGTRVLASFPLPETLDANAATD